MLRRHPVKTRGQKGKTALGRQKGEIRDPDHSILQIAGERIEIFRLKRDEAQRLASRLAATRGGDAIEAAHRRDCLDTLRSALQASVVRTTP